MAKNPRNGKPLLRHRAGDRDTLQRYTRAIRTGDVVCLDIAEVNWTSARECLVSWRTRRRLPATTPAHEIDEARHALLRNREFFRRCPECRLHHPRGNMIRTRTLVCHGCASRNHGVLF